MQTNLAQYDPRENFLTLESELSFTDDEDIIPEEESDDYDEIWVKYVDDEL